MRELKDLELSLRNTTELLRQRLVENDALRAERDRLAAEVEMLREKYDLQLLVRMNERYKAALDDILDWDTAEACHEIARTALHPEAAPSTEDGK